MWANIPNFLTVSRILLVPFTVWSLLNGYFVTAFLAFSFAGITDGLDGYLARKFQQQSELGATLDPLADKLLLVSIYVVLSILDFIPLWLTIIVVSRDVLIIGGVVVASYLEQPVAIKPLMVSKANTVAQISLAAGVLFSLAIDVKHEPTLLAASSIVTILTVWSFTAYMWIWFKHMTADTPK